VEVALARGSEEWLGWWRTTGERELRCILMTAWDPVGAGDAPEAWDEYDSYAPVVAHRLRDATHERRRQNGYLARALVAWHEWSFQHGGRSPHTWLPDA
jgi:hypothetical protein